MALDDGDKETGIYYLQYALATMDWRFLALNPRIERELAELGAHPLPEELTIDLHATPMPTLADSFTPDVTASTAGGIPLPPNPRPVTMEAGSHSVYISPNHYPVLLFQPSRPVSIRSVESMTLHLEPSSDSDPTSFEIFLWDPSTGEWTMFRPGWGATPIEKPGRYVASNGDVYLAIRPDLQITLIIKNVWLTLNATGSDGSAITLDRVP
jgi:hypothetical protein